MCLTHQACHFVRVRPCNSPGSKILRVRGADVSIKPGARAPGSHQEKQSSLRSGRQPHHFNQLLSPTAIARSAGSCLSFTSETITQGSQSLALGLTLIAAPQLFCYRSLKPVVGHGPCCLESQVV
jgi:hypothetical protein